MGGDGPSGQEIHRSRSRPPTNQQRVGLAETGQYGRQVGLTVFDFAMSVYQQVVDWQGTAVASPSEQVFVIVPKTDWYAAALAALPLHPLNASEFVFVG